MSGKADYAVSRVRYSPDRRRIFRAHVHPIRPATLGPAVEATRSQLIAALRAGRTFMTVKVDKSGTFAAAAVIQLVEEEGQLFLRTDRAVLSRDLLDGTQEF